MRRLLALLSPPVEGCELALLDTARALQPTDASRLLVAIESALRESYARGAWGDA